QEVAAGFLVPQTGPGSRAVLSRQEGEGLYRSAGTWSLPGGDPTASAVPPVRTLFSRSAAPPGESTNDFEGIQVEVRRYQPGDALPPNAKRYRVAAIRLDVVYNRFGGHDPNGMLYVLENPRPGTKETDRDQMV